MTRLTAAIVSLLRLVAQATVIVSAAAALGAQAGRFSDDLDALTHFAPYWLFLGVLGLGLWAATGGRKLRTATPIAGLVAIVLAGGLILPELVRSNGPPPPAEGERLKLIQFNLWGRNIDPEGTADWIRGQDADIIVFEEAFGAAADIPRALAEAYPYRTTCAEPLPCPTLILSRRRPVRQEAVDGGQSTAALATWTTPRGDFTVIGTHYIWPWPAGPQEESTFRLAARLKTLPRGSTIVAGDFNSTPWSFALQRQDRMFQLQRRTRALASWPAAAFSRYRVASPFPFLPIDHLYAGADWKTVRVERGPKLGSDHYPVVVGLHR